jgi:hypothetical protein
MAASVNKELVQAASDIYRQQDILNCSSTMQTLQFAWFHYEFEVRSPHWFVETKTLKNLSLTFTIHVSVIQFHSQNIK